MRSLLFLSLGSLAAWAAIGQVSAMRGDVSILRGGENMTAKIGSELEQGDVVKTGETGKAQLLFSDKTSVTVGKNSEFDLKEYADGKSGQQPGLQFGMLKGVFKSVTGNIGKAAPERFKLKTKNATIGIRGTHIAADISDLREEIACLKGGIYVDASGFTTEVDGGSLTEIIAGGTPSFPRTEGQTRVDRKVSGLRMVDLEDLADIVDAIKQIRNDVDRAAAFDALETALVFAQDSELLGSYYLSQVPASYLVDNPDDSEYVALNYAYFTELPITTQNGYYIVDGVSYAHYSEALLAAKPVETWIYKGDYSYMADLLASTDNDLNAMREQFFGAEAELFTPESVIASKIGRGDDVSTPFWDGSAGDRELTTYTGNIIGFSKSSGEYQAIVPDENNQVTITFDFGNQLAYGGFDFNTEDESGNTGEYHLNFAQFGSHVITPTGFTIADQLTAAASNLDIAKDFYKTEGDPFVLAYTMFNRFYGDDAEQVAGYLEVSGGTTFFADYPELAEESSVSFEDIFNLYAGSDGEYLDSADQYLGAFVANKTETVILSAQELGSDEYFSWGFWASEDLGDQSEAAILAANPHGAWIKNIGIDVTSSDQINSLVMSSGLQATYLGSVLGTVQSLNGDGTTELMQNGFFGMNFDFSTASMAGGQIAFDAGDEHWSVYFNGGELEQMLDDSGELTGYSNGFEATQFATLDDSDVNVISQEIQGKFYGENAEMVGGGFQLMSDDHQVAIGAFLGNR